MAKREGFATQTIGSEESNIMATSKKVKNTTLDNIRVVGMTEGEMLECAGFTWSAILLTIQRTGYRGIQEHIFAF